MTFNVQLASELMDEDDRDTARFFVGRDNERRDFKAALWRAEGKGPAVFRVYQGAPGCGKSSLVDKLREGKPKDVAFINVGLEHLASLAALTARVEEQIYAGSTGLQLAQLGVQTATSLAQMRTAGRALSNIIGQVKVNKAKLVLHMEEAHRIEDTGCDGLVQLHAQGLGVPTVALFTGLSHTTKRLGDITGMSRISANAIFNMSGLKQDECVASTRRMLDALEVEGSETEKRELAGLAAAQSLTWPQHLHWAQNALCRELLRTGGVLGDVDRDVIRERATRERESYYEQRLMNSVLALHPHLTATIVDSVRNERPSSEFQLRKTCRVEMEKADLTDDPEFDATPTMLANALVEKGVLEFKPGENHYAVPIPSMADWLRETYGDERR